MAFSRVTAMAHELVAARLRPGDRAVDATVGNGHDTLFLARCVGPSGRVDGFDIQPEAIAEAERKIAGLRQVRLHCLGHECMGEVVSGPVDAIMFNLGYLPSGDKRVITRPTTTLTALDSALGLLADGGLISVLIYREHEGGAEEALSVESWFDARDRSRFQINRHPPQQRPTTQKVPPYLLTAERRR